MIDSDQRRKLFASACGGIFVFGIVLALLGTLFGLEGTRAQFHVNLGQQGDLILLLFLGIFLATLAVGPMLDRFGSRLVLLLSSLLVSLALVEFSRAQEFTIAAIGSVLLGLGGGGLNTATNALVSELYGDARGPMLNVLGIFFGFGALLMPLLAATLLSVVSLRTLMLAGAGLALGCVAAYTILRFPPEHEAQGFSWWEVAGVFRYPQVAIFAFLLFFESGNEASVGGWVSTYAGMIGSSARTATWILAGYWAGMMLGRVAAASLLTRVSKDALVLVSGLGSVAGCALLAAANSVASMAVASAIAGLFFAGIYPTVLAMAGDRYQRFAGSVFSLLFAVALVGGMLIPWAIGQLAQARGVRFGMLLPLFGSAMICVLVIAVRKEQTDLTSR